jgi:glycosyltransferase involved in cell wall biosynthesis
MPASDGLSIFFPAYNDWGTIASLVVLAGSVARELTEDYEIIVVNDASPDHTARILDELRVHEPRLRVVTHAANRGYGGALRSGFENARGELIGFSDGDLQFDLREMSRLLDRLEAGGGKPVEAVIGWRIKRRDPPHRIVIAKTYNAIVSVLFALRVRDIDCAMKLFRREVFDGLRLETDSPFLSAELLIKLRARGERIAQVGVTHYPRAAGTNTGASFRKILRTFRDILRLRWTLWTRRDEVLGPRRTRA